MSMTGGFCSYEAMQSYLYGLRHHGAKYGIDRMRLLVERLGHPEKSFPIIHVAGTNGKGSVCAMLEQIYRDRGLKTGLFTSPHLVNLEERFQVNRRMMPREDTVRYVSRLKVIGEALGQVDPDDHPSFFELVNAIAFLWFKEEAVDLAVVEVGLGGELDSTNVCEPEVSVITSIGLDHTEILGNSLEAIAEAKGGIIKSGVPVVLGVMPEVAEGVLRGMAKARGAEVFTVKERFGDDIGAYPETSIGGIEQRKNAALAVLVLEVLGDKFPGSKGSVEASLKRVVWRGRWERVSLKNGNTLILDCSHNEEGAKALDKNLGSLDEEPVVVYGSVGEARASVMLPVIAKYARAIVLVKPNQPKGSETGVLRAHIPKDFKGAVYESSITDIFEGVGQSIEVESSTIVATGSLYLMGEIMGVIEGRALVC